MASCVSVIISIDIYDIINIGSDKMNNYFNNDLNHPKYLFYGSPKLLEVIE